MHSRRTFLLLGTTITAVKAEAIAPDLILHNGTIHTMNAALRRAEAVAVGYGRFLAVGSNDEVLSLAVGRTRRIDLAGKAVVPGTGQDHPMNSLRHPSMPTRKAQKTPIG
jgi:hypothetical protein